jgi:hypothetical protein
MVMQVLILAIQNAVPYADLGVATAAANFFRSMGGSFGVAIFGAALNARLDGELARSLPASALAQVGDNPAALVSSPEQIRALPADVSAGIVEAMANSIDDVFLLAVPLLLVGFVFALFLKELPLRETAHVGRAESQPTDQASRQAGDQPDDLTSRQAGDQPDDQLVDPAPASP